jgi:hypothetical protein
MACEIRANKPGQPAHFFIIFSGSLGFISILLHTLNVTEADDLTP